LISQKRPTESVVNWSLSFFGTALRYLSTFSGAAVRVL